MTLQLKLITCVYNVLFEIFAKLMLTAAALTSLNVISPFEIFAKLMLTAAALTSLNVISPNGFYLM